MLAEDFDEIECVETQQQHQLVLTFSVIAGSLEYRDTMGELVCKVYTCIYAK